MPKLPAVTHQRAVSAFAKAGFLDYTAEQAYYNDRWGARYHHSESKSD
jgi:hypothetical protein